MMGIITLFLNFNKTLFTQLSFQLLITLAAVLLSCRKSFLCLKPVALFTFKFIVFLHPLNLLTFLRCSHRLFYLLNNELKLLNILRPKNNIVRLPNIKLVEEMVNFTFQKLVVHPLLKQNLLMIQKEMN